jgi:haloalkane dehalogenase
MPTVPVLDSTIYYEDAGAGAPVVFLHGNPTTSHLWRSIAPAIEGPYRRLAPDLIGMGRSGKPVISYSFATHAAYLDAWFDALDLKGVVLVGHDWGAALAFDWAARHPERVRSVVFMEAVMRPMQWDGLPPPLAERFRALRTPALGEKMVLESNDFIEQTFRGTVLTPLSAEDMQAYTAPYRTRASRKPLLQWTRSLPFDGEPADVLARIEHFTRWLAESAGVPKLLLTFGGPSHSLVINPEMVQWCLEKVASLAVTACGPALHNAPEDRPKEIAAAISHWLPKF